MCTLCRLAEALVWIQASRQTAWMRAPPRSLWKQTSSTPSPQLQVHTQTHMLLYMNGYFLLYCIDKPSTLLSFIQRLLLMEKYTDRLLVHPVPVRHDQQIWERIGAHAHHDTSEPQGGSRVWICLQHPSFPCKETNPMHCVYADQRDVFFTLMSSLHHKTSAG